MFEKSADKDLLELTASARLLLANNASLICFSRLAVDASAQILTPLNAVSLLSPVPRPAMRRLRKSQPSKTLPPAPVFCRRFRSHSSLTSQFRTVAVALVLRSATRLSSRLRSDRRPQPVAEGEPAPGHGRPRPSTPRRGEADGLFAGLPVLDSNKQRLLSDQVLGSGAKVALMRAAASPG